jgi:hypothetical protein
MQCNHHCERSLPQAELLCEQMSCLTTQIVVAFADETRELECLSDLQEETTRLAAKEVGVVIGRHVVGLTISSRFV